MKKKLQLLCTVAELFDFLLYAEVIGNPDMTPEMTLNGTLTDVTGTLDFYQIAGGYIDTVALEKYKDTVMDAMEETQKCLDDPNESDENKRNAEMNLKLYPSADNICCFTLKANGKSAYPYSGGQKDFSSAEEAFAAVK